MRDEAMASERSRKRASPSSPRLPGSSPSRRRHLPDPGLLDRQPRDDVGDSLVALEEQLDDEAALRICQAYGVMRSASASSALASVSDTSA